MSEAVAEIAAQFVEAQPPVTAPPADPAASPPAVVETSAPSFPAMPAADGFNPDLHESDAAGKPIKNTDGSLRRKRGRKPARGPGGKFASKKPSKEVTPQASVQPAPSINLPPEEGGASPAAVVVDAEPMEPQTTPEDAKRLAVMIVGASIAIAQGVFDKEEWKPAEGGDGIAEVDAMIAPLAEILLRYDVGVSPEIALIFGAIGYAGKRVRQPKTWERLAGIRAFALKLLFPWRK